MPIYVHAKRPGDRSVASRLETRSGDEEAGLASGHFLQDKRLQDVKVLRSVVVPADDGFHNLGAVAQYPLQQASGAHGAVPHFGRSVGYLFTA